MLNFKANPDESETEEQQEPEEQPEEVQLLPEEEFDPNFRITTWKSTILGGCDLLLYAGVRHLEFSSVGWSDARSVVTLVLFLAVRR